MFLWRCSFFGCMTRNVHSKLQWCGCLYFFLLYFIYRGIKAIFGSIFEPFSQSKVYQEVNSEAHVYHLMYRISACVQGFKCLLIEKFYNHFFFRHEKLALRRITRTSSVQNTFIQTIYFSLFLFVRAFINVFTFFSL